MTWRTEKTGKDTQDLVWSGVESGISPSPLKGTANIQNANISTDMGEIMASYARTQQTTQAPIVSGTLTASVSDGTSLLAVSSPLQAGYWINISSSTISRASAQIQYLNVAGGGGGGGGDASNGAGGGGAGGVLSGYSIVTATAYAVTVGAGGAGGVAGGGGAGTPGRGTSGADSIINTISTATGGGGGGSSSNTTGRNGGSGGGGGGAGGAASTPGTGTAGQGHNGGASFAVGNAGGGGGGASTPGSNAPSTVAAGVGGAGVSSSITGAAVTYGGGGGGAGATSAAGGSGGGGAGRTTGVGTAGTANTGGGGGGAYATQAGGAGGSGMVVISYRTGTLTATGGTITTSGSNTIHTFTSSGTFTVTSLALSGNFFVSYQNTNGKIKISDFYDPFAQNTIVHSTSGTATFSTVATFIASPIAKATEKYTTATTTEYRYYILDSDSYVWVYDTKVARDSLSSSGVATLWMLPDSTNYGNPEFTGMAVLNGWLVALTNARIYAKPTVDLGRSFVAMTNVILNNPFPTHGNYAMVGHQGKMYYCDANYIGELFPTTSLVTAEVNVQSYSSYTAVIDVGTLTSIISGATPDLRGSSTRVPAVFFTDQNGLMPASLTEGVIYYISFTASTTSFTVYDGASGGIALDIQTGSVGNQYFNTFYPLGDNENTAGGSAALYTLSLQRVNLPFFETAQCMVEVGNTVIIGGITNTLYPWNQIDATPSDLIALPESNVKTMINVNNMAYVFAGNKGNIYITNNSVASKVLKVPDYCAGVPGTPNTYIEPYFTWGDSDYIRGRVYFSILDQTATKTGNCGGVWSFVPAQNFGSEDEGLALRLENQNSYGSYNGLATVILPSQEQTATSPQYWTGWQNSYSVVVSSLFGIDFTGTVPVVTTIIETDLAETGTILVNQTYSQVEYKMATPLASGDSVQLYYRLNATDAWQTCGTVKEETTDRISGYFSANFENTQWLQLRAIFTTNGLTTSSFNRLTELRVR